MSRTLRKYPVVTAVLGLILVAGCAEPPTETLDAAHEAQGAATTVGAAEYAPDAYERVIQARAALDAELAAQAERMALRRSYEHAEVLAGQLLTASEEASGATTTAKEEIRTETTTLIADSRMALDSVNAMLVVAPAGKGSSADLAAFRADLDTASGTLGEAETMLAAERYMEARARAGAAHDLIQQVRSALEQAGQAGRRS